MTRSVGRGHPQSRYELPASILAEAAGLKGSWRWNRKGDSFDLAWSIPSSAFTRTVVSDVAHTGRLYGDTRVALVPADVEAQVWAALAIMRGYSISYRESQENLDRILDETEEAGEQIHEPLP